MPFTINETKSYQQPVSKVLAAVVGAVAGLEGKVVSQDDAKVVAQFNKTIHGKVLGDRTQLTVVLNAASENETGISIEAYPLDAVGRKLMFGARKGVTRTVLDWFYAHVENRLK
jgi:ATP-dependent Clp protease ATP-binding subunit ClpA